MRPGALGQLMYWPWRRVFIGARLSGTPMRHLFPRLAAREVLLLPSLVIGPSRLALLVVLAGPLQPLPPGHRRARRAVDVASVTRAADAHVRPASRAREPPRLGRRHRSGVPRALHGPRRARSSTRLSVHCAAAAGDQEARAPLPGLHPQHARSACHTFVRRGNSFRRHVRWVTSGEHAPGVSGERLSAQDLRGTGEDSPCVERSAHDSRSFRSSRVSARIRLLSAVMIDAARSRLDCWSSSTFSSTVSRAISR